MNEPLHHDTSTRVIYYIGAIWGYSLDWYVIFIHLFLLPPFPTNRPTVNDNFVKDLNIHIFSLFIFISTLIQ